MVPDRVNALLHEAIAEAKDVCSALEAAGLVKDAEAVRNTERVLQQDADSGVPGIELVKATWKVAELAQQLEGQGHGVLATRLGQLEHKMSKAAVAEKEKESIDQLVDCVHVVASVLKEDGESELSEELKMMGDFYKCDPCPQVLDCVVKVANRAAKQLRAEGKSSTLEAVEELILQLEEVAHSLLLMSS